MNTKVKVIVNSVRLEHFTRTGISSSWCLKFYGQLLDGRNVVDIKIN